MKKPSLYLLLALTLVMGLLGLALHTQPSRAEDDGAREVKVLVITMFEVGELSGDFAGEAQLWVEGFGLDEVIEIPGSYSPLYCNADGICLMITGVGIANATASVMAVGLSGEVDLTSAYILIAGIAGVDPADGTLGSVAWVDWVIDGELAHLIDSREMPDTFDYPYFRLGCATPWCGTDEGATVRGTEVYHLNTALVDLAYEVTQDVELMDGDDAKAYRANYPEGLPAVESPSVIRCDSFSSSTYWHGALLSDWANWWSEQWSDGEANYCMTNQEDSGTLTALSRLDDMGLLDFSRVLVLRGASNFDQQSTTQTAGQSVRARSGGFVPSINNTYRVGSAFVNYLVENWDMMAEMEMATME